MPESIAEIASDLGKTTLWQNKKSIFICTLMASGAFQYGLDQGLVNGFMAMPGFLELYGVPDPQVAGGYNLSSTVQQLISSLMILGALISSLCAGFFGNYLSRRWCLFVSSIVCIVATFIMIFSTSTGVLYFARILLGLANGWFMPFSMLYIQECAPPHLRGIAANGFQFWAGVGSVIGSVVDNYAAKMPGKTGYQLCCALFVILPVIIIASAPFVPESPRWLIAHGKHHESLHALQRLRGTEYPEALIAAEFREIKETWEIEEQMAHGANVLDMFRGIDLRRTCLAVAGACMQNSSGAMFLLIYGTYFFEVAGSDEPFTDGIILSCTMLASSCIMFLVIRYLGRRTIMMLATLCQGFSMLIIAIVYTVAPTSQAALKCLVGFIVIFIFFYGGFTAPVAWLWPGEIPSTRLRAYTLGLGTAVGFVLGWLVSYTTPFYINPLDLDWGPKYGYIWFPSNLITCAFVFFLMPETKDRTLEEIDEMFINKVPARKFKGYQCVVSQNAREHGVQILSEKGVLEQVDEQVEIVE